MSDAPSGPNVPTAETISLTPAGVAPQSDSRESQAPAIPERLGDYRILRKIGEGGMGAVYLAEDVRLGRKAAVKTMRAALALDSDSRNRFEREARAAAAVDHDNIVPVWGLGEAADGSPYIAMPFLQGETLDARLRREPVSPFWLIAEVGRDVAEGLAAAHAEGLVHRDIKPGNVWLEGDPAAPEAARKVRRAKILDFGLARAVSTDDTQLTATGAVIGTPAYMSPEQARGQFVDGTADLWSLGAVLYRMATGRQPFEGTTTMAVLCSLMADTPPPVRTLNPKTPPVLAALIDQLLQKNPSDRPRSAGEVAARLRQVANAPDIAASKLAPVVATPPGESPPWTRAYSGDTEPDHTPAPLVAAPLPAVLEPRPDTGPIPAPNATRAALPKPPGVKIPLHLALLVLLLVAAGGVLIVSPQTYTELYQRFKQLLPAKKAGEKQPDVKFTPPEGPAPKVGGKQPPGGVQFSKPE